MTEFLRVTAISTRAGDIVRTRRLLRLDHLLEANPDPTHAGSRLFLHNDGGSPFIVVVQEDVALLARLCAQVPEFILLSRRAPGVENPRPAPSPWLLRIDRIVQVDALPSGGSMLWVDGMGDAAVLDQTFDEIEDVLDAAAQLAR